MGSEMNTRDSFQVMTAHGLKTVTSEGGVVLPHEHVVIDSRVWWEGEGEPHDLDDAHVLATTSPAQIAERPQATIRENMLLSDWYLCAKELHLAKQAGTQLVVDLTVLGSGPDTRAAVKAADTAGIGIVISVGRYLHDALPETEHHQTEDQLVERWRNQIHHGIDGFQPGIIGEIGTSAQIEGDEIISLRAAAALQQETGYAMNIHVHPFARQAIKAIEVATAAGATPSKLAVSHLDCDLQRDDLRELADRGVYIEFDNFGTSRSRKVGGRGYPNDDERLDVIEYLIEHGHGTQILLSHDINHRNSLSSNGGWGYAHLAQTVTPQLRARFGPEWTRRLTSHNPLQLLDLTGTKSSSGPPA